MTMRALNCDIVSGLMGCPGLDGGLYCHFLHPSATTSVNLHGDYIREELKHPQRSSAGVWASFVDCTRGRHSACVQRWGIVFMGLCRQ